MYPGGAFSGFSPHWRLGLRNLQRKLLWLLRGVWWLAFILWFYDFSLALVGLILKLRRPGKRDSMYKRDVLDLLLERTLIRNEFPPFPS